jgi:hypothetical protein
MRESTPPKFQPDFRHSLVNMPTNFEQFDSGLLRYDSIIKTSMTKFALEHLLWMILMPNFGDI